MQWCKIIEHDEYGQILAVRENNDDGEPSIKTTIATNIEGVDHFSSSFSYDDSEGGAATRDRVWQEQYLENDAMMIKVAEMLTTQVNEIFAGFEGI